MTFLINRIIMSKQNKSQAPNQPKVTIDPEFEKLLSPQSKGEYEKLKESIKKEGCRDKLLVWKTKVKGEEKNLLVDGHHRYRICVENHISYDIAEISFESKGQAKLWILKNQFARRNLNSFQRVEAALQSKEDIAKEAEKNQKAGLVRILPKVSIPLMNWQNWPEFPVILSTELREF